MGKLVFVVVLALLMAGIACAAEEGTSKATVLKDRMAISPATPKQPPTPAAGAPPAVNAPTIEITLGGRPAKLACGRAYDLPSAVGIQIKKQEFAEKCYIRLSSRWIITFLNIEKSKNVQLVLQANIRSDFRETPAIRIADSENIDVDAQNLSTIGNESEAIFLKGNKGTVAVKAGLVQTAGSSSDGIWLERMGEGTAKIAVDEVEVSGEESSVAFIANNTGKIELTMNKGSAKRADAILLGSGNQAIEISAKELYPGCEPSWIVFCENKYSALVVSSQKGSAERIVKMGKLNEEKPKVYIGDSGINSLEIWLDSEEGGKLLDGIKISENSVLENARVCDCALVSGKIIGGATCKTLGKPAAGEPHPVEICLGGLDKYPNYTIEDFAQVAEVYLANCNADDCRKPANKENIESVGTPIVAKGKVSTNQGKLAFTVPVSTGLKYYVVKINHSAFSQPAIIKFSLDWGNGN